MILIPLITPGILFSSSRISANFILASAKPDSAAANCLLSWLIAAYLPKISFSAPILLSITVAKSAYLLFKFILAC